MDERSTNLGDFELLVDEYGDRIYAAALRITGMPADAEDVLQETFLQAYEHRATFRGEASPATWLYRIAVNAALARLRQRRPTVYLEETGYDTPPVVDWSNDLGRRVEAAELREQLETGISRLPVDFRVVVVLRDAEGLSTTEVARTLELSEAAVKSRLHRGRVLLRQFLAEYLVDR
ncbi:MAG TPA: sigma-70 family RNA polymerase sigma factor [Chloroflexota bacterium]|nr:sigma-70 family RNA polymerase sigma factor [Chloroflexota bacterium]